MKLELSSIKKIVVRELNNENLSRYMAGYIERKKYFSLDTWKQLLLFYTLTMPVKINNHISSTMKDKAA